MVREDRLPLPRHTGVEADVEEVFPLGGKKSHGRRGASGASGKGTDKGKGKEKEKESKTRRTLGGVFKNLNPRRHTGPSDGAYTAQATGPGQSAAAGADMDVSEDLVDFLAATVATAATAAVQDPFADENAMDVEWSDEDSSRLSWHGSDEPEQEDVEMALSSPTGAEPSGSGSGSSTSPGRSPRAQSFVFPCTPPRKQHGHGKHRTGTSSATTTPSPARSAKSKRSPLRGSPYSAKSYLVHAGLGSAVSGGSVGARLAAVNKSRRMHGRNELASQMKALQQLGGEAVGAVASATKVSESRLKRMWFGRSYRL